MEKAARLKSSLLVRKGDARPSVFAPPSEVPADPAGPFMAPVMAPGPSEPFASKDGPQVDWPGKLEISKREITLPSPSGAVARDEPANDHASERPAKMNDTTAVMDRIHQAMAGGAPRPFPAAGSAFSNPGPGPAKTNPTPPDDRAPIDLAAVKRAKADRPAGRRAPPHGTPHGTPHGKPRGKRVSLSLRLDEARHLRVKLFAAHAGTSIQKVLTAALDDYLDREAHLSGTVFPVLKRATPGASG